MNVQKPSQMDNEMLRLWDQGKNTREIAELLGEQEYWIDSRLRQLRETRREGENVAR